MTPQQQSVAEFLADAGDWVKGHQIAAQTGIKGPREIVKQLRGQGYEIESHRAGPRSKGYRLTRDIA